MKGYSGLFLIGMLMASLSVHAGDGEVDLVGNMKDFQYFTHKATLSVDAQNQTLAAFYIHELEEILEVVKEVDTYDDHPVGKLAGEILSPAVEQFEVAVEASDWTQASHALDGLVLACNSCHQASAHSYIKIERQTSNPFMQSFSK